MPSFDTVLEADLVKVKNAVENTGKEIATRFDFKGTAAAIELKEKDITLIGDSDFQIDQINDILRNKLTKAGVDVRFLDVGKVEKIGGEKVKQVTKVRNGIETEQAKKIQQLHSSRPRSAIFRSASTTSETEVVPHLFSAGRLLGQAVLLLGFAFGLGAAQAQSVALAGMLGSKALLIVDGTAPKTVAAGETHQGVKVVSTAGDQAVIEQAGKRRTLRVGEAPVSLGGAGASAGRGTRIVLNESSGGHFMTPGQINGRAVQFMVDTGATNIAMSALDAERAGIAYKTGQPVRMSTANGISQGFRVKLNSVRIGDVEIFDVDAVVTPEPMPFMLLGNSFLSRFQMRRENALMTLDKRY